MRTSFNHQPEAQPPNLPARRTGEPQYPICSKVHPATESDFRRRLRLTIFDIRQTCVGCCYLGTIQEIGAPWHPREAIADHDELPASERLSGYNCPFTLRDARSDGVDRRPAGRR